MNVEPLVFFSLLGLIFLLAGQLTVALWAIKKREAHPKAKESLAEEEGKILLEAQQQAGRILAQAAKGAARIEKSRAAHLEAVSQAVLKNYRLELEKIKDKDINVFGNISKDIAEDLQNTLAAQTVGFQKTVNSRLEAACQTMLAEVEEQKAERLKELDGQIVTLVKAVAEKVLGRTLSLEAHEELIFEALKKAKKEGMFR